MHRVRLSGDASGGALRAALLALFCLVAPARAEDIAVDLELVLAIDTSASIDEAEFALQQEGLATALTDPSVMDAIQSGPRQRIAVALTFWAEAGVPADRGAWFLVSDDAEARAFASHVRGFPRRVNGGTGIGAGIAQSIRHLDRNGFSAARQVVDVSGDGKETPPREIAVLIGNARAMAIARGVTINGLAILNEDPDVGDWYRREVVAGPDNFVLSVDDFDDFTEAMRRKLVREITDMPKIGMR